MQVILFACIWLACADLSIENEAGWDWWKEFGIENTEQVKFTADSLKDLYDNSLVNLNLPLEETELLAYFMDVETFSSVKKQKLQ